MSYRNPRFCWQHMLRDYQAASLFGGANDPPDVGDEANLWDDRKGVLAQWLGDAAYNFVVFKNAHASLEGRTLRQGNLNRILIPKGHDLQNRRSIRPKLGPDAGFTNVDAPVLEDGVAYTRTAPSSGLIDYVLDPSEPLILANVLELRMQTTLFAGTNFGFGELWWTNIEQPTTGIAHGWVAKAEGLFDRIETRSGERYVQKRGESKRQFSLVHENLSGADLKLYDTLYLETGAGLYPFWYEHPDSGGAETLAYTWVDDTGKASSNGSSLTLFPSLRPDGNAGNIGVHGSGGVTDIDWKMPVANLEAGVSTDWRNNILRMQVQFSSWSAAATTDMQFFVESAIGGFQSRTLYEVGGQLSGGNVWFRLEIDLDEDATSFTGPGPADLSNISHFGFYIDRALTSDIANFGDIILIDKTKQPVLVEIVGYDRFQDGNSPSGPQGPSYQIRMNMLEVTT